MAENPNPNPAGSQPELAAQVAELQKTVLTMATSQKSVGDALQSIVENQKVLADTMAKLPPATPATTAGGEKKAEPITAEGVAKIVSDQLNAFRQTQDQANARQGFLDTKMKDLPTAYRSQLGTDAAKWAGEEQSIRSQFQSDLKSMGATVPDVGGGAPGAAKPAATVDMSKLNPVQKIALGLKRLGTPAPGQAQVAAPGAATAAAQSAQPAAVGGAAAK